MIVKDVDLIGPEQGAYQSTLRDLYLRQLKVPCTKTCLVEDRQVSGLIFKLQLQ